MAESFVHLHLHTQYSLLDGAIKIPQLIAQAKAFAMPAVGITDHGNLFGAMEFYIAAKKENIKPIIGCEVYMAPGSRFSRKLPRGSQPTLEDPFHHLTLICADKTGYRNLCKLITISHFEGFYYKPRIDKEILSQYHEGLIALSGCLSGEIASSILQGQEQKAVDLIQWYKNLFGERFYLEIQQNHIAAQDKVNNSLIRYGARFHVPIVGTNDCHYLKPEDASAQEVLLCVQTGKTLQDENRLKFGSEEFYFKSPEEMHHLFARYPQAAASTLEIADICELDFELEKIYLPQFELPGGVKLDEHLKKMAGQGLEEHLAAFPRDGGYESLKTKYEQRLQQELDIISKTGFAGYFLIVSDFVNYARTKGIPVGPGRGSAAGSLVAYCLKITGIDPIPHNLIFERFLNPERISMPDMDIDFCMNRRDEVIHYVTQKYGKENVAQIITFGKMQAKAAIRDVGRVYGFPYGEVDRIAKLVPLVLNITLEEAIAQEPKLKELYDKDDRVRKLLNTALALEGLYRHASIHAAGIVISNRPLVEYMPLFKGKEGEVVTSFDMKHVEKIGLIKFDFLGLKTLTLIDQVVKKIRKHHAPDFDINRIDLKDAKVYQLFSKGDTPGVFQFESSGMRDLLARLKPARFDDIIAANALFRPGPMDRLSDFIDRRHGRVSVRYLLPELKDILQDSYGIIVYQEQVMKIANVLANYSLGEADLLRRAMGKKIKSEMTKQKARFLRGARANGIHRNMAEHIFDLMAKFAEYGFNKSHATAYAYIAFQTAYLKVYYRLLFMAELLSIEMENTDKMARYIQDAKEAGIVILPPDIHKSRYKFSVVGENIRFGLGAVKNVGAIAIESIIQTRERIKQFESLSHFCENVDLRKVNRKVVESLIKVGAFDSMHKNRAQLMESLDGHINAAQSVQADREAGQYNMFGIEAFTSTQLPRDSGDSISISEWPEKKKLRFEKEALGLYVTGHPLQDHVDQLQQLTTHHTENLKQADHKSEVRIGGMVGGLRETITKRGDKMAFLTIEDLKGSVDVIVFSDLYEKVFDTVRLDEPLWIVGIVELSQDNAKIVATRIELLSEAQKKQTSRVRIVLESTELDGERLEELKFILGRYRGNCPVLLQLKVSDKTSDVDAVMGLSQEVRVVPSPALKMDIEKLFNKKVVRFE